MDEPPVETITGFLVLAIFSIRIQSFISELAILMIGNAEVGAKIDGSLVEGCGRGEKPGLADRFHEGCIVVVGQPGVERLLDVAKILAINEVFMDESVHVAELQLDGRPDVIESNHLGERIDDLKAAFEAAEMVIGHFQHKQVFENVTIDHSASSIGKTCQEV